MDNFTSFISERLGTLLKIANDQKLYLVGGFLREKLSGFISTDLDFIIFKNTIDIAKELAQKTDGSFVLLDSERETARVVWNKAKNGYDLNFDLALISGATLENDLKLRDLTINSLCMEITADNFEKILRKEPILREDELIDPTGGFRDFEHKILRTPHEENLLSDPLRILRIFRFAAKTGFSIDEDTFGYIKNHTRLLEQPAKERVLKELKDIFASEKLLNILKKMQQTNIISILFADIYDENSFPKACEYLDILANIEGTQFVGNIADLALFRILLIFFAFSPKESAVFLKKIEKLLKNFHFSVSESQYILKILRFSLESETFYPANDNRKEIFNYFQTIKVVLPEVLLVLLIKSIQEKNMISISQNKKLISLFSQDSLLVNPPQLIDGKHIIKKFGLKPGPKVGELLRKVQEAQAEKIVTNLAEAEDFLRLFL